MKISRREALRAGGVLGAVGLGVSGCAGNSGTETAADGGTPRKGGTLRIGALGRTGAITRDPHGNQGNESDYLILALAYDTLAAPGADKNTVPRLASSWTPSASCWSCRSGPDGCRQ